MTSNQKLSVKILKKIKSKIRYYILYTKNSETFYALGFDFITHAVDTCKWLNTNEKEGKFWIKATN